MSSHQTLQAMPNRHVVRISNGWVIDKRASEAGARVAVIALHTESGGVVAVRFDFEELDAFTDQLSLALAYPMDIYAAEPPGTGRHEAGGAAVVRADDDATESGAICDATTMALDAKDAQCAQCAVSCSIASATDFVFFTFVFAEGLGCDVVMSPALALLLQECVETHLVEWRR